MNQRTPEWFAERAGKVTASRISDVLAKIKTGEAATRANYRAQLVAERLSGKPGESFSNAAMEWGTNTEPLARAAYESDRGVLITEVGFIPHPRIKNSGASPDGFLDAEALIEIKCPNTATHLDYLKRQEVPEKYKPQMAWQLACTDRTFCDFVSFDPRLPEKYQLFVATYRPAKTYIAELEAEVEKFLSEVDAEINLLESIYGVS